jgi:hypothetical protein
MFNNFNISNISIFIGPGGLPARTRLGDQYFQYVDRTIENIGPGGSSKTNISICLQKYLFRGLPAGSRRGGQHFQYVDQHIENICPGGSPQANIFNMLVKILVPGAPGPPGPGSEIHMFSILIKTLKILVPEDLADQHFQYFG